MKQIDIIKTWSKKRCLIVDDIADIRASIKRWCVDFGCNTVDTAGNAQEAIDLCQRHRYDVVLADYNLGPGKNGQQLLEELRFHNILSNTALFVMITAEATSHYVLHALENQPDDYLSKPLNRNALRKRLDAALLKNEALMGIKSALDEHSLEKALQTGERALQNIEEKYRADVQRALAELYCENTDWKRAKAIYAETDNATTLWGRLGMARAQIGLGDVDDAERRLDALVNEFPLCVEARDLQAELYRSIGNGLRVQEVLSQAVKISPRSSSRQRALGQACQHTGEHTVAAHAWRSALKHSKNTCQESPADYLQLAASLNEVASRSRATPKPELTKEALDALKLAEKKYPRHPIVQMRSKQLRAEIYDIQGKEDAYEAELAQASTANEAMDYAALKNTSVDLCIDCARGFMKHGRYEDGEKLLDELSLLTSDPEVSIRIDKLRREPQTREGIKYAATLNKAGIAHYESKDYERAQLAFEDVLKELPNHTGLNMNLLQTLLGKFRLGNADEKDQQLFAACLRRVGHINAQSPHYARYQYMLEKSTGFLSEDFNLVDG